MSAADLVRATAEMSQDDLGMVVVLIMLSPIWIGLIVCPLLWWGPPWRKKVRFDDEHR